MKTMYKNERVVNFKEIKARHSSREIEGCTSWRHFAVHQDRAWLLRAIGKIRAQVDNVRQASEADEKQALEAELNALFELFEEENLNHLGAEDQ